MTILALVTSNLVNPADYTMTPAIIAALAGAILALGLVYWLVRDQDQRDASRD